MGKPLGPRGKERGRGGRWGRKSVRGEHWWGVPWWEGGEGGGGGKEKDREGSTHRPSDGDGIGDKGDGLYKYTPTKAVPITKGIKGGDADAGNDGSWGSVGSGSGSSNILPTGDRDAGSSSGVSSATGGPAKDSVSASSGASAGGSSSGSGGVAPAKVEKWRPQSIVGRGRGDGPPVPASHNKYPSERGFAAGRGRGSAAAVGDPPRQTPAGGDLAPVPGTGRGSLAPPGRGQGGSGWGPATGGGDKWNATGAGRGPIGAPSYRVAGGAAGVDGSKGDVQRYTKERLLEVYVQFCKTPEFTEPLSGDWSEVPHLQTAEPQPAMAELVETNEEKVREHNGSDSSLTVLYSAAIDYSWRVSLAVSCRSMAFIVLVPIPLFMPYSVFPLFLFLPVPSPQAGHPPGHQGWPGHLLVCSHGGSWPSQPAGAECPFGPHRPTQLSVAAPGSCSAREAPAALPGSPGRGPGALLRLALLMLLPAFTLPYFQITKP